MNEVHATRRRSSVGEMDELAQVNESMKAKLERASNVYMQVSFDELFVAPRRWDVNVRRTFAGWLAALLLWWMVVLANSRIFG